MRKFYNIRQSTGGNKWMRLGSIVAKVLNPRDFPVGSEVKMTRGTYQIQADGSIRRVDKVKK